MAMEELLRTTNFICTVDFWRMAFFWPLFLVMSYLLKFAQILSRRGKPNSVKLRSTHFFASAALQKPICIITGATSGLGAASARDLAREGFFVVLVGRSKNLLNETLTRIRKENKDAQLEAFEADLSSFSSISKFKASFEQWLQKAGMHPSVQILINNAGIMATSCRSTSDGLEEMMATNYVGAFCLTKFMLPLLVNSPVPSRIVNVTSFTHRNVNNMQIDKESITGRNLFTSQQYPFARVYEYSKVCLVLFAYSLHQQLIADNQTCHVSVNVADPGSVKTNIMRELPSYLSQLAFIALKLFGLLQSRESGARSVLDACFAPPELSAKYFFGGDGTTISSSALSRNVSLGERLWRTSSDIFLELKLTSSGNIST